MKKVLAIALIGLIAVSCSKGESSEPGILPEDGISFTADAPATRSYFPGSTGTMYWSSYDNLGAYAFDASGSSLVRSDFCSID
ncbi:MAG: DUF4906 domain-containing protein, partial [Bacteroides cellulosilyticus]|nr:DUF4906 domain-containing protein [Bacteroides cellulosilyticus]